MLFISYLVVIFIQFLHGLYDRSLSVMYFLVQLAQLEASSGAIILRHHLLVSWRRLNGDHLTCLIDLRSNGEELTTISSFKTEATDVFDLVMKNMIGVYDTTKYGSIPFHLYRLVAAAVVYFIFCFEENPLEG